MQDTKRKSENKIYIAIPPATHKSRCKNKGRSCLYGYVFDDALVYYHYIFSLLPPSSLMARSQATS
jgi:hypothetical protein